MARIGLKSFNYAELNEDGETYGTVGTLAGAIEAKVMLNLAEGTLYADEQEKTQSNANGDEQNDNVFDRQKRVKKQNR